MAKTKILIFSLLGLLFLTDCGSEKKEKTVLQKAIPEEEIKISKPKEEIPLKEEFVILNDKNAIPFFFEYQKENLENNVRISTRFGNIDIKLYDNTPYHRSNFIYLAKRGYFNGTTFHRVVPGFIIQGGNSDRMETSKKRGKIGNRWQRGKTRNRGTRGTRGTGEQKEGLTDCLPDCLSACLPGWRSD